MIPVGDERNDIINKWLGYSWWTDEHGWFWVRTPSGFRESWKTLRHHWRIYLPRHERPGMWSTDDAAALGLANVELPKRGYNVTWRRLRDGNSFRVNCTLRHRITVTGNGFDADVVADTLADAITRAVCQVAECEAQG